MIVIADSNALIGLAKGGVFGLLHDLFDTVCIPESVWHEVVEKGAGRDGEAEAQAAKTEGWLQTMAVPTATDPIIQRLQKAADRDVIGLTQSCGARWLITDDLGIRSVANSLSVALLNTADILLLAKRAGLITCCRNILDRMIASHFGISDSVYQRIQQLAGE